ncbi:MAG: flagellar hook capping FlgD N-terminal domain-containing protein [Acidobacteriaceae bacterium]
MNIQGIVPSTIAAVETPESHATTSANAAGSTSASSGLIGESSSSLQNTFMNLLVTELQNQDPTSPVDPTEMVGQLVSLNQLDQLVSINQILSNLDSSVSAAAATGTAAALAAKGVTGTATSHSAAPLNSSIAAGMQSQGTSTSPSTATLMNLYSN